MGRDTFCQDPHQPSPKPQRGAGRNSEEGTQEGSDGGGRQEGWGARQDAWVLGDEEGLCPETMYQDSRVVEWDLPGAGD